MQRGAGRLQVLRVGADQNGVRVEGTLEHEVVVGVWRGRAKADHNWDVLGADKERLEGGYDGCVTRWWKSSQQDRFVLQREGGGHAGNNDAIPPGFHDSATLSAEGESLDHDVGVDDGPEHDTTIAPYTMSSTRPPGGRCARTTMP